MVPLVEIASAELEKIRQETGDNKYHSSFPSGCFSLLKSIKGNNKCIDCGDHDPEWATVSFGAVLCLQCSGRHRSLGVQTSTVRSISLDNWSQEEILAMLEGGNAQLSQFFTRHQLCPNSKNRLLEEGHITQENVTLMRYKTKAAQFYREQLGLHVERICQNGVYQGREASRRRPSETRTQKQPKPEQANTSASTTISS